MPLPMQPGNQQVSEPMWWWRVAQHLDDAQLALANAMAHNVDDPGPIAALHDRLREGQAILFEIFRAKGLLARSTNGKAEGPPGMPGMPGMPPTVPVPTETSDEDVVAVPLTDTEQNAPLPIEEAVVASEPEQSAVAPSPDVAVSSVITAEVPAVPPVETIP